MCGFGCTALDLVERCRMMGWLLAQDFTVQKVRTPHTSESQNQNVREIFEDLHIKGNKSMKTCANCAQSVKMCALFHIKGENTKLNEVFVRTFAYKRGIGQFL